MLFLYNPFKFIILCSTLGFSSLNNFSFLKYVFNLNLNFDFKSFNDTVFILFFFIILYVTIGTIVANFFLEIYFDNYKIGQ